MIGLGTASAHAAGAAAIAASGDGGDGDADCVSVLAECKSSITLLESRKPFFVAKMISHRNPDIALAELPRPFIEIFGGFEIGRRGRKRIIRQCIISRAVGVRRLRMEFESPCHLDCDALYDLLRIHRQCGEVRGGLSVGKQVLPNSNALFLLDKKGQEHCISLKLERARWYLYIDQPSTQLNRFNPNDVFLVPNFCMRFRRQFGKS